VRPDGIVVPPPVLYHNFGLLQCKEYFLVQHLISQLPIDTLIIPVLARPAGVELPKPKDLFDKIRIK
jgi:hypothetical protein